MSFWERVAEAEDEVSRWPRWKVAAAERVYESMDTNEETTAPAEEARDG